MRTTGTTLSPEQFRAAFPFFLQWDAAGRLIDLGASSRQLLPELTPGVDIWSCFTTSAGLRVTGPEATHKLREDLLVLEHRTRAVTLRGHALPIEGGARLYLCSPWLTGPAQLEELGLSLSSFAIHDSTLDLLFLLDADRTVVADLRRLSEQMKQKSTELEEAVSHAGRLAMVALATDHGVFIADVLGRVEFVNAAFTRLTGWTAEQARGREVGSLLPGSEGGERSESQVSRAIAACSALRVDLPEGHREGTLSCFSLEMTPVADPRGVVTHFVGLTRQIEAPQQPTESVRGSSAAIDDLVREVGPESTAEILELWTVDALARAEDLVCLAQSFHQESLLRIAHAMKSSSALVGLPLLQRDCAALERLAHDGDFDGQTELADAIVNRVRCAIPAFLTKVSELRASSPK